MCVMIKKKAMKKKATKKKKTTAPSGRRVSNRELDKIAGYLGLIEARLFSIHTHVCDLDAYVNNIEALLAKARGK
jgi:hypothetical protein